MNRWQRLWILVVSNGVANLEILKTHHSNDVASHNRLLRPLFAKTFESIQFFYLVFFIRTVTFNQRHVHASLQDTAFQTPHGDTANI